MTNQYPPPPPPNYPAPPAAKPSKPVYTRWWFWVGIIVVVGIIGSALGGGSKDGDDASGSDTPSASTSQQAGGEPDATSSAPKAKVSQGLGANDASRDVTLSKLLRKKEFGSVSYTVDVTVTNNSSKRSDYFVTVALESADGKEQIDTATVIAQNIEPGQTKRDSGTFLAPLTNDAKVPDNAKLTLQEVQRTEST